MNKEFKINAADNSGSFSAFASFPAKLPAPTVIVIQEIFGVNKNMRDICEKISQAGYIAVCPDLFWRQEPGIQLTDQSEAEWARAFQLYQGFDVGKGINDLRAALAFIRKDPACTGKAGTIGYCLGGKLAYLMATGSDADCNVAYYGVGIEDLLGAAANIAKPLLMHVAEKDQFVPPAARQKITNALHNHPHVEIHVYPGADHAFARIGGQHYDPGAAQQANGRTAAFLAAHLVKN
ncbi:MAG: dienelactone hydrolase family protein [Alphaproteobacteria bacterium]|nr:dienelactone hydrolase family protein [Alphaproteobacteria bacterium]